VPEALQGVHQDDASPDAAANALNSLQH
jgi:hypothetical protein